MKLFRQAATGMSRSRIGAFTLTEIMFVMAIFTFIIAAIVAVQLFALRVYTLGSTKLSATTDGRQTMSILRNQIRAAKLVYVGTYSNGSFSRIPSGGLQIGNALELATTNNATTNFLVYYLDNWDPTNALYSISNSLPNSLTVHALYVTNFNVFFGENYLGAINNDYENNTVIHVVLQFYRWEYPLGFVGTNALNAYDFYYLTTRVMRRAKD